MSSRWARVACQSPFYEVRCDSPAEDVELECASGAPRAVWNKCAIDSPSAETGAANNGTEQTVVRAPLQGRPAQPGPWCLQTLGEWR